MVVDEVSSLAKKDSVILMIGARLYKRLKCQTEKKHEVEKQVKAIMQLLAFRKETDSLNDASDISRREAPLCSYREDDEGR